MSAVEKVAANAAFSSSPNSIGQSSKPNIARKSTTKLPHVLPPRVSASNSPLPTEKGLESSDSSDTNSEFGSNLEETLKNIKALNGPMKYSESENFLERLGSDKNGLKEKNDSNQMRSSNKSILLDIKPTNSLEKPKQQPVARKSTTQGSLNRSTMRHNTISIDFSQLKQLKENSLLKDDKEHDVFESEPDIDNDQEGKLDKYVDSESSDIDGFSPKKHASLSDNLKLDSAELENQLNDERKVTPSDDNSEYKKSTFSEKLRNSFDFVNKMAHDSNSDLDKVSSKSKNEDSSSVQSVSSTSDSTKDSSKQSSERGNLFENFQTIASADESDDKDDSIIEIQEKEDNMEVDSLRDSDHIEGKNKINLIETIKSEKQELSDSEKMNTAKHKGKDKASNIENISFKTEELKNDNVVGSQDNNKISESKSFFSECIKKTDSGAWKDFRNSLETTEKSEIFIKREERAGKSDINIETKCFDGNDVDTCVKSEYNKCIDENYSEGNNDKKRPAKELQDKEEEEGLMPMKRSRLDAVIGKLGSHIGITPEVLTYDDTYFESEESSKDSDSSEKQSDTASTEEEDDKLLDSGQKIIQMSEKDLQEFITREVNVLIKIQEQNVSQLQKKIEELQANNETWKGQAKELQKQVLELTILQQRHEKRKAAAAALRQITTRNVAVQVDDGKGSLGSQVFSPNKQLRTPPKLPAASSAAASSTTASVVHTSAGHTYSAWARQTNTITTTTVTTTHPTKATVASSSLLSTTLSSPTKSKIASPVNTNVNVPRSVTIASQPVTIPATAVSSNISKFQQSPTVKSLLDATRNPSAQGSVGTQTVVYNTAPSVLVVSSSSVTSTSARSILTKPVTGQVVTATTQVQQRPVATGNVKVIDLTGDDENTLKNQAAVQSRNGRTAAITPVAQVRPGMVQQQVVRQVTPAVAPGTSFLLSTPAGTQIISSGGTQGLTTARPGVCQYVLTSTTGNIRPGSLVTVVPTPATQNSAVRPPIGTNTVAAGGLPQLRAAQPTSLTNIRVTESPKILRPPPPLQSAPVQQKTLTTVVSTQPKHPAPLPLQPNNQPVSNMKAMPPKPGLKISRVSQGIVLSWNMTVADTHAEIGNYQLYAYQEGSASPSTTLWKKVGDVKALPLPMACTLTQFQEGNKYHFAVRAVDTHGRVGPFSDPSTINLAVTSK